ncbi:MAG: DUF2148 domain-containing protein [Clostridiales bacterium]|nr:DUF2148 domain-containing protein [Clostridiales bacterium]
MILVHEEETREKAVKDVAERMALAARTAPKARGIDNLAIAFAHKETIRLIALKMKGMAENGLASDFFIRDANNILQSEVLFLIGTKIAISELKYCGLCGYANCEEKQRHPSHPCVFNTGDLGIAIGSAVSVAMDARVDNRIMYSVGMAVREMKLMGADIKIIYGIPLSCSGKNLFFDRK